MRSHAGCTFGLWLTLLTLSSRYPLKAKRYKLLFHGKISIFRVFLRFNFFTHSLFKVNYFGLIVKQIDLKEVLAGNSTSKRQPLTKRQSV
jgi:membrane-anchored glycerophosphoryl diester phosphodiesterase (GDPDase)